MAGPVDDSHRAAAYLVNQRIARNRRQAPGRSPLRLVLAVRKLLTPGVETVAVEGGMERHLAQQPLGERRELRRDLVLRASLSQRLPHQELAVDQLE